MKEQYEEQKEQREEQMEEQKVVYPCRATERATIDCPRCGRTMQLKCFKYAHKARCPGPSDSVVARAKEEALKSFSAKPCDDRNATHPAAKPQVPHHAVQPQLQVPYHAAPPEPQRNYDYLLAHLLR